jgi:hypothetical protein
MKKTRKKNYDKITNGKNNKQFCVLKNEIVPSADKQSDCFYIDVIG